MRGERQRAKARVRAYVARRLIAADVLLARGQRQYETAPPILIDGFAAKAAWHLTQEFLARRKQSQIGPAEIQAVPDGLTLGYNDIRAQGARRFQRAKRHCFRHNNYQQRACLMSLGG